MGANMQGGYGGYARSRHMCFRVPEDWNGGREAREATFPLLEWRQFSPSSGGGGWQGTCRSNVSSAARSVPFVNISFCQYILKARDNQVLQWPWMDILAGSAVIPHVLVRSTSKPPSAEWEWKVLLNMLLANVSVTSFVSALLGRFLFSQELIRSDTSLGQDKTVDCADASSDPSHPLSL